MTVPLDMGLTFGIGMTFGIAGDEEVKKAECATKTGAFRKGLLYNTFVALGIAAILYKISPDWMLMYYTDHEKIPKPVKLGLFSLYNLMYVLGFIAVRKLEAKREGLSRVAYACCMIMVNLYTLISIKRLLRVGTIEEFRNGEATFMLKSPVALVLGLGGAVAVPLIIKMAKDISEQ